MATAREAAPTKRAPKKTEAATLPAADGAFVDAAAAAGAPPVQAALAPVVGPSGVDGIPARYADGKQWLLNGVRRHPKGALVALLFSWTGFWLALWGAVIGAGLGTLIGLGAVGGTSLGQGAFHISAAQAVSPLTVLAGFGVGLIGGFFGVIGLIVYHAPFQWIVGMFFGLISAIILIVVIAAYERLFLRLRGYRRLSRDEVRRVAPLVKDIAEGMDLDGLPRFAMADAVVPNAWAHMRTIVITTGLLQSLDDGEIRAILAHELHHWRSGDSVGLHLVWACAWPMALACNVGMYIAGVRQTNDPVAIANRYRRGALLAFIGWVIAWPAWTIIRFAIVPVISASQRRMEYEADAAAAELGYGAQLSAALRKMSVFESGRTGWENTIAATHPPTELRIEALQPPQPDDAIYQEDELRSPTWAAARRILWVFGRTSTATTSHRGAEEQIATPSDPAVGEGLPFDREFSLLPLSGWAVAMTYVTAFGVGLLIAVMQSR